VHKPASTAARRTLPILDDHSLDADESYTKYSPFGVMEQKPKIFAETTESATLDILTWEPDIERDYTATMELTFHRPLAGLRSEKDPTGYPPTYHTYESVSLSADTLETYTPTTPSLVMAVKLTMGGTAGTADLWVDFEPY